MMIYDSAGESVRSQLSALDVSSVRSTDVSIDGRQSGTGTIEQTSRAAAECEKTSWKAAATELYTNTIIPPDSEATKKDMLLMRRLSRQVMREHSIPKKPRTEWASQAGPTQEERQSHN